MDDERKAYIAAQAKIFKALGHPSRLLMVDALLDGEKCVCDLQALVGDDMSTVSKHLAVLREAGVVTDEKRGNGPAHYFASAQLQGRIGFIDAVSHRFCASCNRVRLTSTGQLKPCLSFDSTVDLRALLRAGCSDEELREALRDGIFRKPRAHRFDLPREITEKRIMSQIGG